MLLILLLIALPVYIACITAAVIAALLIYLYLNKVDFKGKDFYLALLLAFVFAGAGNLYLGSTKKSLVWYLIQITSFVIAGLLPHICNIESKYLGLIIMAPFIIQLIDTCTEYKSKYGDISSP